MPYKNSEDKKRNNKKWRSHNFDYRRDYMLKYTYGISQEQYLELLNKQNGRCFICGRHHSEFKQALHVDHAHGDSEWVPKGAIRGLLCHRCNVSIIGRQKDPKLFERAAEYLKQHTGWFVPPKKKKKRKRT